MDKQEIPPGAMRCLDDNPVVAVTEKQEWQDGVQSIEDFVARGGKIEVVESGLGNTIMSRFNGQSAEAAERLARERDRLKEITQEKLKEEMHYDPETGLFTWLISRAKRVKVGDIAGGKNNNGCILITLFGQRYLAHRLAFLYMTGSLPSDQIVHINQAKDDNSWTNIRLVLKGESEAGVARRKKARAK